MNKNIRLKKSLTSKSSEGLINSMNDKQIELHILHMSDFALTEISHDIINSLWIYYSKCADCATREKDANPNKVKYFEDKALEFFKIKSNPAYFSSAISMRALIKNYAPILRKTL